MNLQERRRLLEKLGAYISGNEEEWKSVKQRAYTTNPWFTPEFTDLASIEIAGAYLSPAALDKLQSRYQLPELNPHPRKVGIVMAGNIPMVGFHDLLCVFITGHIAVIKPSSKDDVLIPHLVSKMHEWDPGSKEFLIISEMVKNCDAYIATGSGNTARHFEYYFRNHPHIIRSNRTSIAILTGQETSEQLEQLADDVYLYFGLGCRNVTKIYVPDGYDFVNLLQVFRKYNYLSDHNKYKNNYDYNLSLLILNKKYYMANGSIILVEDPSPFSRISQLHYEYYSDLKAVEESLRNNDQVQCVVSPGHTDFGKAQSPGICDFADGVDTMDFLNSLT